MLAERDRVLYPTPFTVGACFSSFLAQGKPKFSKTFSYPPYAPQLKISTSAIQSLSKKEPKIGSQ